MVNRILLRIKTVQIVYSFYQGGNNNLSSAEKEFLFSLGKSYELYNYFLYLPVKVTHFIRRKIENAKNKLLPTLEDLHPNTKFIDNRFVYQLEGNQALNEYMQERPLNWDDNYIRSLADKIMKSEYYKDYMDSADSSYKEDKEIWVKLFKKVIFQDEDLETLLEEECLYWNDDVEIVSTFVIKTIKRFEEEKEGGQELLPMFKDEEDKEYGRKLLRSAIANGKQYREWIDESIRNWDIERIAFMDIVIMQVALAELTEFPEIPANVTFNEYLNIAKIYSTEKSNTFINGVLDNVLAKLKKSDKLIK